MHIELSSNLQKEVEIESRGFYIPTKREQITIPDDYYKKFT